METGGPEGAEPLGGGGAGRERQEGAQPLGDAEPLGGGGAAPGRGRQEGAEPLGGRGGGPGRGRQAEPLEGRRVDEQSLDAMQRLWTPWRMAYIRDPDREVTGCPFCVLPQHGAEHDRESLIVHRGALAFVILNAYPYNPGHLMIVPFRHVAGFDELGADELCELGELSQRAVRALKSSSGPDAFNIGINVGGVAGAGIADHIHQHVVPRWGGDTNFMPVIGHTRVLPELLEETYDRLTPAFADS